MEDQDCLSPKGGSQKAMSRDLPWKLRSASRSKTSTQTSSASAETGALPRTESERDDSVSFGHLSSVHYGPGIERSSCDASSGYSEWPSCFFDGCPSHLESKRRAGIFPRLFWAQEIDVREIIQLVLSKWDEDDPSSQEWVVFTQKQAPCFFYNLVIQCDLDTRSIECYQDLYVQDERVRHSVSRMLGYDLIADIEFEERAKLGLSLSKVRELGKEVFYLGNTEYVSLRYYFYAGLKQRRTPEKAEGAG